MTELSPLGTTTPGDGIGAQGLASRAARPSASICCSPMRAGRRYPSNAGTKDSCVFVARA